MPILRFLRISKMKVRPVHPLVGADGAEFLTAPDFGVQLRETLMQVTVERVDVVNVSVLGVAVGMANDDHVSPTDAKVIRVDDDAVPNRVDRVTKIGVAAAASVPVFAQVTVGPESTGLVVAERIRFADWIIEAVRENRAEVFHRARLTQQAAQHESGDQQLLNHTDSSLDAEKRVRHRIGGLGLMKPK